MLTLHRLSFGYRFLYSAVLLFMTAGTLIHTVHQEVRTGISPAAIDAWYLGNENDPAAATLLFPKPFEEVIGDSWTALTTYTLAFLIFGGVLMRSDASPRLRAVLLLGYALGALATAAAPPLVRYASPAFAPLDTGALVLLPLLALAMTVLALRDMWPRRAAGPRVDRERTV